MTREIALTRGQVAIVDDEDFQRLNAVKWFAHRAPNGKFYACRQVRCADGKQRPEWMHKVVLGISRDVEGDHIDGDSLNNRRGNLRPATSQQNLCNRDLFRNNRTGFRGVVIRRGRFVAQITSHQRTFYIGQFGTAEEAARAFDAKASELHGPFARLNFPEASAA